MSPGELLAELSLGQEKPARSRASRGGRLFGKRQRRLVGVMGVLAMMPVAVSGVSAVHDEDFELDGNAVDNSGAALPDDWDKVFAGTDGAIVSKFVDDPLGGISDPDEIFTIGGSKDDLDIAAGGVPGTTVGPWNWTLGNVPDKDNIEDAFAAAYNCDDFVATTEAEEIFEDPGTEDDFCLYFGLDRFANNGDAQVGFWFFQSPHPRTGTDGGTFENPHDVGDVLILSDFTNGGVVSTIRVFQWLGVGGDTNNTLDNVFNGVACTQAGIIDVACAQANTVAVPSPWPFDPKSGANDIFPKGSFFEGGVNLSALGLDLGCGAGFLAETRSSQSVDAQLKDFAEGEFSLCSADIQVSADGVNRVGTPHTVTGHVNTTFAGTTTNAPDGTTINFSIVSGPGSLTPTSCQTTGGTGSCSVTLNSATPGLTTVHATSDPVVAGTAIHVETDGTAPNSDDLVKRWVDARISIDPDDVNRVGQSHTFTVLVEANTGSGWAPVNVDTAVTVSLVGDADSVVDTCLNGTGDAGDLEGVGQCFVTFTSDTPGIVTGSASATVALSTAQGNINVPVSTGDANSPTGSAIKRFVDARITISESDTNGITENHTFTVFVEKNDGSGWAAAAGVTINSTITGTGSIIGGTCGPTGPTDASGECTVIVTSAVAGVGTVNASGTVHFTTPQGNIDVAVATDGYGMHDISNVKTWIDGSLTWIKHDGNSQLLGGATFTVCRTIDRFLTDIVPDECVVIADDVDGVDDTSGDRDGTPGEFRLDELLLGTYTITETTPPAGYTGDPFVDTVVLTLAAPDGAAAHIWVNTPPGEGCTPGFWKTHEEVWDEFDDPAVDAMPTGYEFTTDTLLNTYFGLTADQSGVPDDFTMLDAASATGGGLNKLLRHGVSALLNVNSVNYPIPPSIDTAADNFIDLYNAIKNALLTDTYEPLATQLAANNELDHQNCPS